MALPKASSRLLLSCHILRVRATDSVRNKRAKRAGLLGYTSAEALMADSQCYTAENRRRCERLFEIVAV